MFQQVKKHKNSNQKRPKTTTTKRKNNCPTNKHIIACLIVCISFSFFFNSLIIFHIFFPHWLMTNLICDYILTTKNIANHQCSENVYSLFLFLLLCCFSKFLVLPSKMLCDYLFIYFTSLVANSNRSVQTCGEKYRPQCTPQILIFIQHETTWRNKKR